MLKVAKFGGTSLANAEQVGKVCAIVTSDPARRIVVVSAPGKSHAGDTKVTDLLIGCADCCLETGRVPEKELNRVVEKYAAIVRDLGLSQGIVERVSRDLSSRLASDRSHAGRFTDHVKAGGEDNCAWLMAEALRQRGADAHYVNPADAGLLLSSEYGAAQVLPQSYEKLRSLRDRPGITIFPGFFGVSVEGYTVTFPRGGSDITGAVLAAAVKADLYENFTDVDSVYTVDPRVVKGAPPISELTYREMRELAYAGFGVFHDEAIVPAVTAGIPICIKNTNRPQAPGTRIVSEREYVHGSVVGIAASDGFCTVFVSKYMLNKEKGFGRQLLQIFEKEDLSYEHTPSGIDNMSVVLRESDFTAEVEARVTRRIRTELLADVSVERGLALLMIVGEGMQHTVGLAAKATAALAAAGVNIEMINQGSSEISMMFGIKAEGRERAVRSLHEAFFRS